MPFHDKLKEVFVDPAVGAGRRLVGHTVESARRTRAVQGDPFTSPGRFFSTMRWLWGGGEPPFLEGARGPEIDLSRVTTSAQARDAINSLIGFDRSAEREAEAINRLRNEGGLERILELVIPEGWEPATPFSIEGQSRFATGNFEEFRDPYVVLDQSLGNFLSANPEATAAYLRDTDPMSLLPVLIEQDAHKVGAEKSSLLHDIGGRILGGMKATFWNPIFMAERMEELAGFASYNQIPDIQLRHSMGKRLYDLRGVGLFQGGAPERRALRKVDEILARGLAGEEAVAELDQWFRDSGGLGFGGMVADLTGKIVFDPLWFVPFEKGVGLATKPVKAAIGAKRLSLLGRLTTPTGRSIRDKEGLRYLMQLPEAAYAEAKWASPSRGLSRLLFSKTPGTIAESAKNRIGVQVLPVAQALPTTDDLHVLIRDLNTTFKSGRLTGLAAERLPRLLDEPDIAELVQMTRGGDDLIPEEFLTALSATDGPLAGLAHSDQITLFDHLLSHRVRTVAQRQQERLWGATPEGRFLTQKLFPFNATMRGALGVLSLNNPGFVFLNFTSNLFRHMWQAGRHPFIGFKTAAHSIWTELSAVTRHGGQYTDEMMRLLSPTGLTPLDVERFIANQSGSREIFDIGRKLSVDIDKVIDDDSVDVARGVLDTLRRASGQPVKHVGEPRRLRDTIAPFIYFTSRVDNAFRRATFFQSLAKQGHVASAPSKVAQDRLIPPIARRLTDTGVDGADAERLEDTLRDVLEGLWTGRRPLPAGKTFLDDEVVDREFARVLSAVKAGEPEGLLSGSYYARLWKENQGYAGEALVAATQDVAPLANRISAELLPRLGKDLNMKQASTMLRQWVQEYFDAADIARQLGRMDSAVRPATTYSAHLRLTDQAMRAEMVDTVETLERFLRAQHFGDDAWLRLPSQGRSKAKRFHAAAEEATVRNGDHLIAIRRVYDRFAGEQGLTEIAGDTLVPREWLDDLPDVLKVGKTGKPKKNLQLADLWDNYFRQRDESWSRFFEEAARLSPGNASAREGLRAVQESLESTFRAHREVIAAVPARAKELDSLDAAWAEAASKVEGLYARNSRRRPALLNLPPNDPNRAAELLDAGGAIAHEMNDFVEWTLPRLRRDFARIQTGELRVGQRLDDAVSGLARETKERLAEARQTMIANARAETDFVMLNYNNQYGADQVFKSFVPFSFWPSREAVHWGIRAVRQPGAFAGLVMAMTEPRDYLKQYGYPTRLRLRIPIYMPFLQDALRKVPGLGDRLGSGDFAPYYWVDPLQMLFPYKTMLNSFGFDDPERRNTPAGRTLDYFENYTPFSFNPFMKMVGAETGLLDRDAWRSFGFQGGPFGIPLTPAAREVGRWFYEGDESAIPAGEQEFYAQRGYFSKGLLGRVLGLEPGKFDVYRAERALWTLVATGELFPGKSKEDQAEAAWLALDSHSGPAWRKAVKAAESETFLRQVTSYVGFPAGAVTSVNEGEVIWLGLKSAQGEAARRGELDKFYERFPEFEIRSAVVKGISDPEERDRAVDTELYYQSLDKLVERPFQAAEQELTDELDSLREMEQSQTVRDQISVIEAQLGQIEDEKDGLRAMIDRAYPNREQELSLNRDPRDRALSQARAAWFEITWDRDKEPYEALLAKRETFIAGLAPDPDPVSQEQFWHDLAKESWLVKIRYSRLVEEAIRDERYGDLERLQEERDGRLEALHETAGRSVSERDFLRYMGSFSRQKTPEEREFEVADAIFDFWMSLVDSGSPFSSREKGAISAYFRSLPEIQKYFPLEVLDLDDLSFQQRLALDRRKEFWRTFNAIPDNDTKLDYLYMVKPEIDEANALLGLPPVTPIDVPRIPYERLSDPLLGYAEIMASLNQERLIEEQEDLAPEERRSLQELLLNYGEEDETFGSLSGGDIDRIIQGYTG